MKGFIIAIVILFVIFIPITYAQPYDSQSVSSHYNQYSPDNINNPYSQSGAQYSPNSISSHYSQSGVQYSPRNVSSLPVQKAHDYHVGYVGVPGATKGKGPTAVKGSPDAALTLSFLNNTGPKKNIPLFFYLLVLSSLAVGATILIIIGLFKK